MSDREHCEECGSAPCACEQPVDGYECQECGFVPTRRELNRGTCPACGPRPNR